MEYQNDNNLNADIKELQERVTKLERKKEGKDIWDILNILGSLLIPVAIAYTGFLFTRQQQSAELLSSEKQQETEERFNQANIEVASIQAKVEQSQVISTLLEALSSPNSPKRQLAVKAVEIALKSEDAKKVLDIVVSQDADPAVVAAAEASLGNIRVAIDAESNEQLGFQAILSGNLAAARKYFEAAYRISPTRHNIDEIYNQLLATDQIQKYENANETQKSELLLQLYQKILRQYSWGMPEDIRQEMNRRIKTRS
jgi:hypothetical protein